MRLAGRHVYIKLMSGIYPGVIRKKVGKKRCLVLLECCKRQLIDVKISELWIKNEEGFLELANFTN